MVTVSFKIDYGTRWGEALEAVYTLDGPGGLSVSGTCRLTTADGFLWSGSVVIDRPGRLVYAYRVVRDGATEAAERGERHSLLVEEGAGAYELTDSWNDGDVPGVVSRLPGRQTAPVLAVGPGHLFCLTAPDLPDGEYWAVLGSTPELGAWDVSNARRLQPVGGNCWIFALPESEAGEAFEYKYVRLHVDGTVEWEQCCNRRADGGKGRKRRDDIWAGMGGVLPRLAGVVVPVFSLRSEHSCGIGDFGDLRRFVGWAASVGMKAVQLLPVNDTTSSHTWRDSYPYSSVSVFAFHPIYMDLEALAGSDLADEYAAIAGERRRLEQFGAVDYEAVMAMKLAFIRVCFERRGDDEMSQPACQAYFRDNVGWLKPYAAFCCLRDEQGTADFRKWGEWSEYDTVKIDERRVRDPSFSHEYDFYLYTQFKLHEQMTAAHDEARRLGVLLKGDIPIGICRDSVPAWVDGRLFHFDGQAGAPPDDFARDGQNWGFPTYDWDAMAHEDYAWWKARLRHMARYFDAYRIDHVLGFFRIWEIPSSQVYGLLGHFRPALPLSVAEMEEAGFRFDTKMTVPRFSKRELDKRIGAEAAAAYFVEDSGAWSPRPGADTQRAVMETVGPGPLRDELMALLADVLFIEDKERRGFYHPRVAAQLTSAYVGLDASQQAAFNHLYDDFYYVRHNGFWREEALKKLPPVVGSTAMLPCAEDLGMVPASVKGVLEQLEILSLEIERMPKEPWVRFGRSENNPYLSVATISTHDMPPLRLWWHEQPDAAQEYWTRMLGQAGTVPEWPDGPTCEAIIVRHLACPSMLCLLAVQDWLSMDEALRSSCPEEEQINNPANAAHYWRYRVHLTVEQLESADSFNRKVRKLIEESGR